MPTEINKLRAMLREGYSSTEMLATMSPELVERMLENHYDFGKQLGEEYYKKEAICRLLASGMSADEIAIVLKIEPDFIDMVRKSRGEEIAKYREQLKGRRYRLKRKG